jgi:hypothetical protein
VPLKSGFTPAKNQTKKITFSSNQWHRAAVGKNIICPDLDRLLSFKISKQGSSLSDEGSKFLSKVADDFNPSALAASAIKIA